MNLAKKENYQAILHDIERGQYEIASQKLSQLREEIEVSQQASDLELIRKLLTLRLSIRNGYEADSCIHLDQNKTKDLSLKGEIYFIQGMYFSSKMNFSKSLSCYRQAEEIFKSSGWIEKALMSAYNRIACEINLHGQSMKEIDYENLLSLQKEAENHQARRILGLISRQKSYYFKDQSKWRAAAFEAESALVNLELYASRSDYQIALLNLCDCYLELNEKEKALTTYERVTGYLDRRVIFINDYIEFRLNIRTKPPEPTEHSDPHFLNRWKDLHLNTGVNSNLNSPNYANKNEIEWYYWNTQSALLRFKQQSWKLRRSSKETVLIETLLAHPQSTQLIAEKLWPDYTDLNTLTLRLYQHISRINKKFPNLIISKNGKYFILCQHEGI